MFLSCLTATIFEDDLIWSDVLLSYLNSNLPVVQMSYIFSIHFSHMTKILTTFSLFLPSFSFSLTANITKSIYNLRFFSFSFCLLSATIIRFFPLFSLCLHPSDFLLPFSSDIFSILVACFRFFFSQKLSSFLYSIASVFWLIYLCFFFRLPFFQMGYKQRFFFSSPVTAIF